MNLKNKKIFIIGGLGYIGSLLSYKLLKKGYSVIIYDSLFLGQDFKKLLQEIKKGQRAGNFLVFIKGDTRNRNLLEKSIKKYQPDFVFHFGEIVGVPACNQNPKLTKSVNFDGSKNVVDICAKLRIPLIYNSTSSLYGVQKHNRLMKETDKLPKPTDNYCQYKLKMENYIKNKLKSNPNFKVIIFRPATICGPSIRMRLDLLPNHFSYCAVSSGVIRISQPKGYRAFMSINDLIEAYFKVLKKGAWEKLIYNIGHYNLTKIDCARVIQKIIPCQIILDPHVGDKRNLKIDYSAFKKEFNFNPKVKFVDIIKEVISWLKRNQINIEKNKFKGILNATLAEWQKMI